MEAASEWNWADAVVLALLAAAVATIWWWRRSTQTATANPKAAWAKSAEKPAVSDGRAESGKLSLTHKLAQIRSPKKMAVFYGSQTGTAEDLSTRFAALVTTTLAVPVLVANVEEYEMSELAAVAAQEGVLVGFFLATYGEGEPTDSALDFMEWLMGGAADREAPVTGDGDDAGCLYGLKFVAFGLGNRTYEYYNMTAKQADARLRLWGGAERIGPLGLGDDAGCLDADYEAWAAEALRDAVAPFFGLDADNPVVGDANTPPLFDLERVSGPVDAFDGSLGTTAGDLPRLWGADGTETSRSGKPMRYDAKLPLYARVVATRGLFGAASTDEFLALPQRPSIDERLQPPSCTWKTVERPDGRFAVAVKRECVHVELNLGQSNLRYETGDHVGIWPWNTDEATCQLVRALGLDKDAAAQVFRLHVNEYHPLSFSARSHAPTPCSVWVALKYYLDITRPLRPFHVALLAQYAASDAVRAALTRLASDRALFDAHVGVPRRSLADLLEAFGPGAVNVPLGVVLGELLHAIPLRYYSIASSSRVDTRLVAIAVAIVRYAVAAPPFILTDIASGRLPSSGAVAQVYVKQGLASALFSEIHHRRENGPNVAVAQALTELGVETEDAFLARVNRAGPLLPVTIRRSKFKLPRKSTTPVILVGPGTGIAPFRAFAHDRATLHAKGLSVGPTVLFYGCRHASTEFAYLSEWRQLLGNAGSSLLELQADSENCEPATQDLNAKAGRTLPGLDIHTAFSRDGPQKVYVQHRLAEQGARIYQLLSKEGAVMYVCGDAQAMAADVQRALVAIGIAHGGQTPAAAEQWLKTLRSSGRFLEDVW